MIIKNSEEEDKFIAELTEAIRNINTNHINNKESLEIAVQEFADKSDATWYKHSKCVNITK